MKTIKTTLSAFAILAIAGPALAADFTTLDVNADGQVSFDEYKAVVLTEGKTVTLVAQEFTRMAQGDAVLTEDEFFLAEALSDQPYEFQPSLVSEPLAVETAPMAFEATEVVETFETSPQATETIEPPVETVAPKEEAPAPVIMEKAIDVDPVVAGEVETSIETPVDIDSLEDVTPMEEIELSDPNPEMELELDETDTEIDLESDVESDPEEIEGSIESGEIY